MNDRRESGPIARYGPKAGPNGNRLANDIRKAMADHRRTLVGTSGYVQKHGGRYGQEMPGKRTVRLQDGTMIETWVNPYGLVPTLKSRVTVPPYLPVEEEEVRYILECGSVNGYGDIWRDAGLAGRASGPSEEAWMDEMVVEDGAPVNFIVADYSDGMQSLSRPPGERTEVWERSFYAVATSRLRLAVTAILGSPGVTSLDSWGDVVMSTPGHLSTYGIFVRSGGGRWLVHFESTGVSYISVPFKPLGQTLLDLANTYWGVDDEKAAIIETWAYTQVSPIDVEESWTVAEGAWGADTIGAPVHYGWAGSDDGSAWVMVTHEAEYEGEEVADYLSRVYRCELAESDSVLTFTKTVTESGRWKPAEGRIELWVPFRSIVGELSHIRAWCSHSSNTEGQFDSSSAIYGDVDPETGETRLLRLTLDSGSSASLDAQELPIYETAFGSAGLGPNMDTNVYLNSVTLAFTGMGINASAFDAGNARNRKQTWTIVSSIATYPCQSGSPNYWPNEDGDPTDPHNAWTSLTIWKPSPVFGYRATCEYVASHYIHEVYSSSSSAAQIALIIPGKSRNAVRAIRMQTRQNLTGTKYEADVNTTKWWNGACNSGAAGYGIPKTPLPNFDVGTGHYGTTRDVACNIDGMGGDVVGITTTPYHESNVTYPTVTWRRETEEQFAFNGVLVKEESAVTLSTDATPNDNWALAAFDVFNDELVYVSCDVAPVSQCIIYSDVGASRDYLTNCTLPSNAVDYGGIPVGAW